jgi:hypothetical protein
LLRLPAGSRLRESEGANRNVVIWPAGLQPR